MKGPDNPYRRVYQDLLVIRDLIDKELKPKEPNYYLMPDFYNPLSDHKELHDISVKHVEYCFARYQDLINDRKVTTCQGIGLLQKMEFTTKEYLYDTKSIVSRRAFNQIKDPDTELNLEYLLQDLEKLSQGESPKYYSKQDIDRTLENWKSYSGKHCAQVLIPVEIINNLQNITLRDKPTINQSCDLQISRTASIYIS